MHELAVPANKSWQAKVAGIKAGYFFGNMRMMVTAPASYHLFRCWFQRWNAFLLRGAF